MFASWGIQQGPFVEMGIKGLWAILQPSSDRLASQERLKNHRLAIDASIWMYQLSRALPEGEAASRASGYNPLVLAGLLRRVCKLIHFGIKPVLVFDGGVPILKSSTIRARQSKRAEADSRYKRLAKKMLRIRMSMAALGMETEEAAKPAAPLEEEKEILEEESSDESDYGELDYDQLDGIDINSADFKSLPLDLKQELLLALKERAFTEQLGKTALHFSSKEMDNAGALEFSKNQIDALVKRRKITGELEKVSKSGYGSLTSRGGIHGGDSHKIASSSTKEFVLIKSETGGWSFTDKNEAKGEQRDLAEAVAVVDAEEDDFDSLFFAEESFKPVPAVVSKPSEIKAVMPSQETPARLKPTVLQKQDLMVTYVSPIEELKVISVAKHAVETSKEEETDELFVMEEYSEVEEELPTVEKALEARPAYVPAEYAPEPEEVLIDENEYDFLAQYQTGTKEELIEALDESLYQVKEELSAAKNESSVLENELLVDFQHLLTLIGLPWMVAPMEAEAQCAWLQAAGLVDGIITDDSDVFVFAPPETSLLVYRHFFKDKHPVQVYGMPRIRLELELDRKDLVILALLLGGDYCVGVRGVGSKRGFEILKLLKLSQSYHRLKEGSEFDYCHGLLSLLARAIRDCDEIGAELELEDQKKLEKILGQVHHIEEDFPSEAVIRAYLEPHVSDDRRPFTWSAPNPQQLEQFLAARLSWSPAQFKSVLGPILRKMT